MTQGNRWPSGKPSFHWKARKECILIINCLPTAKLFSRELSTLIGYHQNVDVCRGLRNGLSIVAKKRKFQKFFMNPAIFWLFYRTLPNIVLIWALCVSFLCLVADPPSLYLCLAACGPVPISLLLRSQKFPMMIMLPGIWIRKVFLDWSLNKPCKTCLKIQKTSGDNIKQFFGRSLDYEKTLKLSAGKNEKNRWRWKRVSESVLLLLLISFFGASCCISAQKLMLPSLVVYYVLLSIIYLTGRDCFAYLGWCLSVSAQTNEY